VRKRQRGGETKKGETERKFREAAVALGRTWVFVYWANGVEHEASFGLEKGHQKNGHGRVRLGNAGSASRQDSSAGIEGSPDLR
jgi:hypothetical protein